MPSCHKDKTADAVHRMESCLHKVVKWMSANRLKLNPDKTEVMWFSSLIGLKKYERPSITFQGFTITPKSNVRLLGVELDESLTMEKQVQGLCRSCFFQLRQIRHVRCFLNVENIKLLVSPYILSKIDYCNSLLANLPMVLLTQLQRVLNSAARTVLGLSRSVYDLRPHIRDSLHWLRIQERINYKLCLLAYKSLNGLAPPYISDLCTLQSSRSGRHNLRSANNRILYVPRYKLNTMGKRSFSVAGPTAWNRLPAQLRSYDLNCHNFCTALKSHLFVISYDL